MVQALFCSPVLWRTCNVDIAAGPHQRACDAGRMMVNAVRFRDGAGDEQDGSPVRIELRNPIPVCPTSDSRLPTPSGVRDESGRGPVGGSARCEMIAREIERGASLRSGAFLAMWLVVACDDPLVRLTLRRAPDLGCMRARREAPIDRGCEGCSYGFLEQTRLLATLG